ncbi:4399_t:CDS:10 [Funneliformis caledonium]|uniref:4399_t:CDS:1 n=1 Tax=Funneliformis caledonium TaxID=1117310 RepID=A0A9N8ZXS9_9GLOM|nr:4399_t:CDS:10 [Funneliformis caledonium]
MKNKKEKVDKDTLYIALIQITLDKETHSDSEASFFSGIWPELKSKISGDLKVEVMFIWITRENDVDDLVEAKKKILKGRPVEINPQYTSIVTTFRWEKSQIQPEETMVSTTSEIDTVRNFLNFPGNVDIAELATALGIMNVSLEGPNGEQRRQAILDSMPLSAFFTLLGSYDDAVTSAACKVLEKLLRTMNYADIESLGLKEYLTLGLQFNSSEVRMLALSQVEKCLESEETVIDLVRSQMLPVVLEGLGYDDNLISTKVTEFLVKFVNYASGLQALFDSGSIAILDQLSHGDETVKFRVFDLVSRISISSPEAFQLCETSGALNAITSELNSNDLLLKLNAIETFSKIVQSRTGYTFLERAGTIQSLVEIMAQEDDNDIVLVSNMSLKINTINIIGVIGSNPRGLKLLNSSVSPKILCKFLDLYHSSAGDVKIACLQSISCLLGVSEESTPEISDITHQIYNQIGGDPTPLSTLLSNVKQTLEELRITSFAIMRNMALHPWGQTEMTNSREFIDYILNRSTETTKLGKEWKFTIIQTLVQAPNAENIIPSNIFDRLTRYLREGPFFVRTEAAVTFESA